MLDQLTLEKFAPLSGQEFSIQFTPEVTLPAKLISAQQLRGESRLERQPFSLIFQTAQKDEYYQQSTCIVKHPEIGELSLFLVPIGVDELGMKYEVVFS